MKKDARRATTQMVRIDSGLWERAGKQGAREGRTARQEIEHRLRSSLDEAPDDHLTPAHAITRLVAFLSNRVSEFAGAQPEVVTIGISRLLNQIRTPGKLGPPEHDAEKVVDVYLLRIVKAHESALSGGEQERLLELQDALAIFDTRLADGKSRSRRGRGQR